MRDYLIEFLQRQIAAMGQQVNDMTAFLKGLTGEPLAEPTATPPNARSEREPEQPQPCARRGNLIIPPEGFWISKGGDKTQSQSVSGFQQSNKEKEEEENLKHITKRADGRWQGSRTIDGKRYFVYGKTQRETYEKLKALSGRKAREPKRESLSVFALWWLKTYKLGNVGNRTYQDYENTIKAHINVTTPINKVTTVALQELLNSMPPSRVREKVYIILRQVIRKAYELDYIKKDVSAFLTVGKKENKSPREALTLEEQKRLINALGDDMFSRRVLFYLCTGARPAEIATVRQDEIKTGWILIHGTKTKNAVRWIKVSAKISDMLRGESSEFFKFDNKRFRERLQRFCEQNNVCDKIDVYTLRHTFATNLYILRVPEKDRQTYMGHAPGSALTNGVYTTFSPDTTPQNIYDIYGDLLPEF